LENEGGKAMGSELNLVMKSGKSLAGLLLRSIGSLRLMLEELE
jgi:hypothetical protein